MKLSEVSDRVGPLGPRLQTFFNPVRMIFEQILSVNFYTLYWSSRSAMFKRLRVFYSLDNNNDFLAWSPVKRLTFGNVPHLGISF